MTRIAFVRHGRANVADNLCIGHTDVPLSTEGADAIRALVTGTALQDAFVTSSDLRRATESAAIIAEAFGCEVHRDRRLREMHFGNWDGRSWAQIERDDDARFRDWMERWVDVAPPGGESASDVARRASEWMTGALSGAEQIVVVSHAGWIRAALCHLLGRELRGMFELPVDYAHATIVDVTTAGTTIVAANVATLDATATI
jgi:broad specificity phosphatase PhoE